jgi:hypothetical protein
VTRIAVTPLLAVLPRLAAAIGRHPAFLGEVALLPGSGMAPSLRLAWDALVTVARHWIGSSWPSMLPPLLAELAAAPRNLLGCTALLRDVLPPAFGPRLCAVLAPWMPPPPPTGPSGWDTALLAGSLSASEEPLLSVLDALARTAAADLHEVVGAAMAGVCAASLTVGCVAVTTLLDTVRVARAPLLLRLLRLVEIIAAAPRGKLVLLSADVAAVLAAVLRDALQAAAVKPAAAATSHDDGGGVVVVKTEPGEPAIEDYRVTAAAVAERALAALVYLCDVRTRFSLLYLLVS